VRAWPYDNGVVLVGGAGPDVLDTKGLTHLVEGNGGGDTFIYDRGYGLLEIIENDMTNRSQGGWKANTLSFGAGISPAEVTVRMTGVGSFELSLGHGDLVVFHGNYGIFGPADSYLEYHGKFTVDVADELGIDEVIFADGTRWSYPDLVARQVSSDGVFYGVSGDSTLDTHGQTHVIASEGGEDRIIYKRGYGPLLIAEFAPEPGPDFPPHNIVIFGRGITAEDIEASTSFQNLCLWVGGRDMITIGNALTNPVQSMHWGIEAFKFADGTTVPYAAMLARAQPATRHAKKPSRRAVSMLTPSDGRPLHGILAARFLTCKIRRSAGQQE
jgi:hypothetical protein